MNKFRNKKAGNKGMTYVELIVVLGIFSVLLSISLYNHKKFQEGVDVKNLANDIALKLVEAQKSSISGKLTTSPFSDKPSYGVYFNTTTPTKFIYFADLDNSNSCNSSGCTPPDYSPVSGELKEVVNITKGNTISSLQVFGSGCPATVTNLSIVFKRPSSNAMITSNPSIGCTISYVGVNITSPQAITTQIKIYPSGRIQIN